MARKSSGNCYSRGRSSNLENKPNNNSLDTWLRLAGHVIRIFVQIHYHWRHRCGQVLSVAPVHRQEVPARPRSYYWSGVWCPYDHNWWKANQITNLGHSKPLTLFNSIKMLIPVHRLGKNHFALLHVLIIVELLVRCLYMTSQGKYLSLLY